MSIWNGSNVGFDEDDVARVRNPNLTVYQQKTLANLGEPVDRLVFNSEKEI